MSLTDYIKTSGLAKKIGISAIVVATYFGSIHNTKGLWPFIVEGNGKGYGIQVAFQVL